MKRVLGWTTEKQAQQLIKAGLSAETADMWYDLLDQSTDYPKFNEYYLHDFYYLEREYPCWSLGALIGLLPKVVETKKPKNLYFPEILPASNGVTYTAYGENKEFVFLACFTTGADSDATLLDNVVAMICWLLENNYIKKEN